MRDVEDAAQIFMLRIYVVPLVDRRTGRGRAGRTVGWPWRILGRVAR